MSDTITAIATVTVFDTGHVMEPIKHELPADLTVAEADQVFKGWAEHLQSCYPRGDIMVKIRVHGSMAVWEY